MKTIFDTVFVSKSEYSYFEQLDPIDQINYFFDLYIATITPNKGAMDLSAFFGEVRASLEDAKVSSTDDITNDQDRVDIMIDNENIMIESNSLRAVRHIALQFIEAGYILSRDKETEKMFRKDKITRYMRIFKIINQVSSLCLN